jgi:glucose/arabinose dehydrogenase
MSGHITRLARLAVFAAWALAACGPAAAVDAVRDTEKARIRVETFTDGLVHPWAIAFLPDGRALVTERPGRLRLVGTGGALSAPLTGVPGVDARGQGGLLDVAIDPEFAASRLVYLSFAETGPGGTTSTAVARGRLAPDDGGLEAVEVIFRQEPKVLSTLHYGSRLVFDGGGHLFVTMGERSDARFRTQAQDLSSLLGKIARITSDGAIPGDNPFVGRDDARAEIWAYGIRNSQAAALHPETGDLWEIEHGPRGGDEINVVRPGANYGWPVVSHGVNYSGTPVGSGRSGMAGAVGPIHQWTPVIAPSGMLFYGGEAFPGWSGNLFVGGLRSTALVRLELDGETVAHEERIIDDLGLRIRDVAEGPDGALYLATDHSDGQILKISPAD